MEVIEGNKWSISDCNCDLLRFNVRSTDNFDSNLLWSERSYGIREIRFVCYCESQKAAWVDKLDINFTRKFDYQGISFIDDVLGFQFYCYLGLTWRRSIGIYIALVCSWNKIPILACLTSLICKGRKRVFC